MKFEQLFNPVSPEEVPDNVFTLFGKAYPVVTVRTLENCNAMVASYRAHFSFQSLYS